MKRENLGKAIDLRHRLHRIPEASAQEIKTKKTLIEFLKSNTSFEIVDKGNWFYAAYRTQVNSTKEIKTIAFRAEMDAVKVFENNDFCYRSQHPGMAHKCGHDGHCSALCAFALAIEEEKPDINIILVFQFGEETGEGAYFAKEVVKEEGIDRIYAIHNYPGRPVGSINIKRGSMCCASVGVEMIFTGKSTHASTPELGCNPAKTISEIVIALNEMAEKMEKTGLVLATVIQIQVGERAFGVSASEGRLLLTVRGEVEAEMKAYLDNILSIAEGLCKERGLLLETKFYEAFPDVQHSEKAFSELEEICHLNGFDLEIMDKPLRTSEDFGYFLRETEGALLWVGAGIDCKPLHDNMYDYNDDLIEKSVDIFQGIVTYFLKGSPQF